MGTVVGFGAFVEKAAGVTATQNFPLHASSVAGDDAIILWAQNDSVLGGTKAGLTLETTHSSTGDTLVPMGAVYKKTLTATDITNGFVAFPTPGSPAGSGQAVTIRGFDISTHDFANVFLDKTATTSSFAFGTKTIGTAGSIVFYLVIQNSSTGATTPASGYTETGDRVTGRNIEFAYQIYNSTGVTAAITPVMAATTRGVGLMVSYVPAGPTAVSSSDTAAGTEAATPAATAASSDTAAAADALGLATITNLIANPSAETNTAGWTSNGTLSRSSTLHVVYGSWSLATTATGPGPVNFGYDWSYLGIPVVAGQRYVAGADFQASTSSLPAHVVVDWRDSGGALLSTSSSGVGTAAGNYEGISTAPPGAVTADVKFGQTAGSGGKAIDGMYFYAADSSVGYFDGDTPDDASFVYAWTGTPHASTSTRTSIAVVAQPVVSVSSSDSATGTDAQSVDTGATSKSSSDSGAGTEAAALAAGISGSQAATGTEGTPSLAATITSAQAATGSDAAALSASAAAADTATATETQTAVVQVSSSDTATATEAVAARGLTAADTGVGTEAVGTRTLGGSDTATGAEQASLAAAASSADTATGTQQSSLAAAITSNQAATGTDAAQQTGLAAADTATATEVVSARSLTAADTATGTQAQSLDTGATPKSSSDSVTATETAVVTVIVSSSDSATGTETGSPTVGVASSDSATATEAQTLAASAASTETGTGSENAALAVTITSAETGTATEAGTPAIALSTAEVASAVESQALSATIAAIEVVAAAEAEILAVILSGADTGVAAEAESVLNLAGAQEFFGVIPI